MSAPMFRPLGFGEILDGAFTLYRRNLAIFLVTALIPTLVIIGALAVLGASVFGAMLSGDPLALASAMGAMILLFFVGALVYVVMWGALTRQATQAYLGQPISVGDGMRTGLQKLISIVIAGVLCVIVMMVAVFALAMVAGVMAAIVGGTGNAAFAVLVTFVMFLIMAGVYLVAAALLFAVVPAIVVEGKGPLEAIGRSIDLARGALGRVVGLMVVTLLITYLPMLAVGFLTGGFASLTDPNAIPSGGQVLTQQLLSLGVGVLTTPFMVSVIVLLYFDRRVRTEALDVRMAADRLAYAGD